MRHMWRILLHILHRGRVYSVDSASTIIAALPHIKGESMWKELCVGEMAAPGQGMNYDSATPINRVS